MNQICTGIFDFVPQETEYPYITIGEMRSSDISTKTNTAIDVDVDVNVYSRDKGSKESLDILEQVYQILHDASLSLGSSSLTNLRFSSSEIIRQPDGLTYLGISRFRAVVESN